MAKPRAPRRARTLRIAGVLAVVLLIVVLARHAIVRVVLEGAVSLASGYQVKIGDQHLGWSHGALVDVHVRKDGDPVIDAQRIDVFYTLRDLLPGGTRLFGVSAVAIDRPVITITRHRDGTLTFSSPASATSPTVNGGGAPLDLTARIRDGEIRLHDDAPLQPDLATQTIENIAIDASVKSDARTTARIDGTLVARRAPGIALARYPLNIRTLIDVRRGLSITQLRAQQIPLRGPLAFFIHTHAVRFDDGVVTGVRASAYALGKPGADVAYTLGGTFALQGGRIEIPVLRKPLRDLDGPFTLQAGTLATPGFTGTLAGTPLHGRGTLFDLFGVPRFHLAIAANGQLAALKTLSTFSAPLPVTGTAHIETLLAAQLGKPFIHSYVAMASASYAHYPIAAIDGFVDYYNSALLLPGMHASYGAARASVAGRILFSDRGNDIAFVADAHGAGSALPYTSAFAPDAAIDATALITEAAGVRGFSARGTVAATGGTSGAGTFDVNQKGEGTFGPFSFSRSDGSSLAGAFELSRPISASTGWIHLRGFRLSEVKPGTGLPGARIPALPPIAGVVDGDFAGGGTPSDFGLAGAMHGRELQVAGYRIGTGSVRLGGTVADMRLSAIAVDGPLGKFAGNGAYGRGVFAVEGRYDGSLADLRPFTNDPNDRGEIHGPVRAAVMGTRIAIQTTGADLPGGSVRGIPVERIAGTIVVSGKDLRVVAADGAIAGSRAVAADMNGPFLVSASGLDAGALRGAGIPLQAGRLALFGTADLRGSPHFDGGVALEAGRTAGYPVSGATDVALAGTTATLRDGSAALGATYGTFSGSIGSIGHTPDYDLDAAVPIGEIGDVRRALHIPLRTLEGSFAARVHVGGAGAAPRVAGDVRAREGSYNGLAFSDAQSQVVFTPTTLLARDGSVTVGTTRAALSVDASLPRRAFALSVHAPNATLSDFDDYFDDAEVLDGRGAIAASFSDLGPRMRSSGRVALTGLRVRRFAFGTTGAQWSQRGNAIDLALAVHSAHGALRAGGTIVPGIGAPAVGLRSAAYRTSLDGSAIDLNTWLPALGIVAPVTGAVDLHAIVAGQTPKLEIAADATLADGTVFGYKVKQGVLHATSDGGRIALSNSTVDLGFARFDIGGTVGLAPSPPLALSVHVLTPDIAAALAMAFPKSPKFNIGGTIEADARITGTISDPRITAGFDVTNARYTTLSVPRILGSASYDGRTLEIEDAEATFAHGSVLVAGSLPLDLATLGIDADAPLSFTVGFTALDLAPFAPFVPGTQTKLGGTVDGRIGVEGTLHAPRVVGGATLANGTYSSAIDRAGITAANAQLTFQGTSVTLAALHAKLGSGQLDGHGSLDLPFPGVHTSGYTIDLTARDARIDSPQFGSGTVNGTLQLVSSPARPVLSGDLVLTDASIPVSAVYGKTSAGGSGTPLDLGFNLTAKAGRNVRVKSAIIDVGASGTLVLTGTLANPQLAGVLTATPGGLFSTYNRTFRIQEAVVSFDPARGVIPVVDLRAYAHVSNPDPDPTRNAVGSADITVTVSGPADELAQGTGIVFSSNPPYSQEQIVGLLLDASIFGAVNFAQNQNGTGLNGAPGESNALLPPGTTPTQTGTINFNQEAFSVLNGQFTQRFLAPFERFLGGALNLTDIEITVDYGGGIGYNALKQIGHRDVYASFGQTLSYPVRTTAGVTARPNATTSIDFNYFTQDGNPAITTNGNGTQAFSYVQRLHGIQPLSGQQGFTFLIVRKYP